MPSPFPGMDPYLEGSIWSSVHAQLSVEVARQLAPLIRPRYLALMNRRFVAEMPRTWIEIRDVEGRRLVTSIEILTSTDKEAEGREEYLARRRDLLQAPAHLLEIDLLRDGMRAPEKGLPEASYLIVLSRAERRSTLEVWPVALEDPLPTVPVPLRSGDPNVALDLQRAFTTIYDVCGFGFAVDYREPPDVPLPPEQAAWAEERLRAAGLRT